MSGVVLAAAVVLLTAVASPAQQTTSSSATKTFEVLAVDGNQLVVRLPEGTRELTVPDDFRFIIEGRPMSVHELIVGMKGTATITTRTTVTPVTVTEVRNGEVLQAAAGTIAVKTGDNEVKRFSQSDVDKRGVQIMRDGRPAQITDFREGDPLSATIITSRPPQITTEREVQATLARATPPPASPAPAPAPAPRPAAAAPAPPPPPDPAPAPSTVARALPHTASSWPLVASTSVLLLAIGLFLSTIRRFVD
jgi:hypothetical protein